MIGICNGEDTARQKLCHWDRHQPYTVERLASREVHSSTLLISLDVAPVRRGPEAPNLANKNHDPKW